MSSGTFKRILIIDDSIGARLLLEKFFRNAYPWVEIRLYDPIEEGRPGASFDWNDFDLLVLDLDLGKGENGLDWLRAAREQGKVPATILLTAHGDEELVVRAFKSGVHEYLSKLQLKGARLQEAVTAALAAHVRELERADAEDYRRSILNTSFFYRTLTRGVADAEPGSLAALFLVRVNEISDLQARLGLLEADLLASSISDAVYKACAPYHETASVTRIGDGTVAALVLGVKDIEAVRSQAKALCRVAATSQPDGDSVQLAVSVGAVVVTGGTAGQSADAWLERADAACRVAARQDNVAFHVDVDGGSPPGVDDANVPFSVAEAISKDRVQVQYQGLVCVSEAGAVFDASFYQMHSQLVDTLGRVNPPSAIVKTADGERMLDRWMLRTAFVQLQLIGQSGVRKAGLLSSLSQDTLYDQEFFDWIGALTEHIGRPELASGIVFEVSANALLVDYAQAAANINRLRDTYGLSFALYQSSNAALFERCRRKTKFEFARLAFKGVEHTSDAETREFAAAVAAANAAGALTIGDQIANAAQLTLAVQSGVDFVQGNFIQEPQDEIIDAAGGLAAT